MTAADLNDLKQRFLERTNQPRSTGRAFQAALRAASGHNILYRESLGQTGRRSVRDHWTEMLREMTSRYTDEVPWSQYEQDVEALRREMNRSCGEHFRSDPHPRYGYDPGFRISHAQKSLAIALKHLWCLGKASEPPQCPVDGLVLQGAGLHYPDTRWAYVNSLSEHRSKIEILARRAEEAEHSLAVWELSIC